MLGIAIWNTEDGAKNVTWLEEWPAWIKVYMHSMRVTVDDVQVSKGKSTTMISLLKQRVFSLHYDIRMNC